MQPELCQSNITASTCRGSTTEKSAGAAIGTGSGTGEKGSTLITIKRNRSLYLRRHGQKETALNEDAFT